MTPPLENSKLKGVEGASSLVSEERNSLISRRDIALRNKAERKLFFSRVALSQSQLIESKPRPCVLHIQCTALKQPTVMDQKRKCSLFAQSLLNTSNTVTYESRESNERENSCSGEQFIRINFSGFIPSSQFSGLEGC